MLRGWLESSASEGEKWLRSSAQDGDLYAMENLGLTLLKGDGLPKLLEEGLGWLKRLAELGSPFSMEKLAEYELDESEARTLLRKANAGSALRSNTDIASLWLPLAAGS
jgi:TPR repeat protein